MDFLEFLDKKAEEENWLDFFLALLEFLSEEELKWTKDENDPLKNTYYATVEEKNIVKIIISTVENDCTIFVEDREGIIQINIYYCVTEEGETKLYGFYRHNKNIETAIVSKREKKLVKSKLEELHKKLTRLRS